MTTEIKPRHGDWYRQMAEDFERYAESVHTHNERGRAACLAQAAEYRHIGANVDLAMSGKTP